MPYENSPLLPNGKSTHCVEYGLPIKTETSIYDRFTPQRKRMILVLISLAGMIPCEHLCPCPCLFDVHLCALADFVCASDYFLVFVIGSFVPCIPQISRDLRTTGAVIKQVFFSPRGRDPWGLS